MKTYPQGAGFCALFMTICLNAASLLWLRRYSASPDQGLILLALGYVPMALGLVFLRRAAVSASQDLSGQKATWAWIGAWAASVVTIYSIFLMFPRSLSVSQLIIAQSVTPLLAVIVTGDYRSKEGRQEPLRRLIPLMLLLVLAWLQHDATKSQGGGLSFLAVCGAFLIAQSCMRHLSKVQQPLWVLPRFALVAIILIVATLPFAGVPSLREIDLFSFGLLGAGAGAVLILIQAGYLFGLSRAAPFLSATAISSSVPVAMFFEWLFNRKEFRLIEACLASLYCLSVIAIAAKATAMAKTAPVSAEGQASDAKDSRKRAA